MDIEQTYQLLQLILNSVVMVAACVVLLSGLLRRHGALSEQLRQTQRAYEYLDRLRRRNFFQGSSSEDSDYPIGEVASDRAATVYQQLSFLKRQLHQLRQRYRSTHYSVLAIHYALLFLVGSTLLIMLRTVIAVNSLIPLALVLFIAGVSIQLLAVSLTLYDLHAAHRSLWVELRQLLVGDAESVRLFRRRSRRASTRSNGRAARKTEELRSPKAKVS